MAKRAPGLERPMSGMEIGDGEVSEKSSVSPQFVPKGSTGVPERSGFWLPVEAGLHLFAGAIAEVEID